MTFVAWRNDGTTFTKTVTTDGGNFLPETIRFDDFVDVNRVRWTQTSPFHQFDNVVLSSKLRAANQQHNVTVKADDGRGGIDTQTFTLFTVDTPPNSDPVFDSTPPLLATVGQPYGYFVSVTDPDFDVLELTVASGPDSMVISSDTGLLTWTPSSDQAGPQSVTLRANDHRGGVVDQQFTITVGQPAANLPPSIHANPNTDGIADVLYQYHVIATDPNGDFLNYELVQSPQGMEIDPLRGLITWTPTEAMQFDPVEDTNFEILGTTEVIVRVSDGRGGSDDLTYTILVRAVDNLPPRIDSLPPSQAEFGTPYIYDVDASDLDGDHLTYSLLAVEAEFLNQSFDSKELSGLSLGDLLAARGSLNTGVFTIPAGMAIDPDSGVLTWTPGYEDFSTTVDTPDGPVTILNLSAGDNFGVLEIIVRVDDGNGGFDLQQYPMTVSLPNGVPVITSQPPTTAVAGLSYRYSVTAQDPESEDLTYELSDPPAGMGINAQTGVIDWTPSAFQQGTRPITVIVTDTSGGEATQTYQLAVAKEGSNAFPLVFSDLPTKVRLGGTLLYRIEALDPNGDPLTFTLTKSPAGMTIGSGQDAANLLRWKPNASQVGSHLVTLQISDGRGGVITQSGTVSVSADLANEPPQIISTPGFSAVTGKTYFYDVAALDPDGDQLFFDLATRPIGMSIDQQTGAIRWTPTADQLGSFEVAIDARDPFGGSGRQSFTVTVRPVNLSPMIQTTPPTRAFVDRVYGYGVGATDPDGDPIGIELVEAPDGMELDASNGVITWRPGVNQVGSHRVSVQVVDFQGGEASQTFNVVVQEAAENIAPTITSTPPAVAQVNVPLTYVVQAIDPEGMLASFGLEGTPPSGLQLNSDTGWLTWTPDASQLGDHSVTVVAIDAEGAKGRQTFDLNVRAANRLPVINGAPLTTGMPGETYRMNFPVYDPDGDRLNFGIEEGPAGMTIDANGRVQWDVTKENVGVHSVALTAGDAFGFVRLRYDLTIRADQQAPQVQISLSQNPLNIGNSVTVTVKAVDDVRVASLTLTSDGEAVVLDSFGRATLTPSGSGALLLVAKATDGVGHEATDAVTLQVVNPNAVGDPLIVITSPEVDQQISGPIAVTGTISDPDLVYYTIEVAPVIGGQFVEVYRGTTNVIDGVLGTFDPTLLQNDEYILRVYATDSGGNDTDTQVPINVVGDLKLGNFTLSFTDLTVPVSGIPISVTRTYDTLTAGHQGDFGHGWRMEFRDVDLRTSVPATGLEDMGIYGAFTFGTRVYLTLPGGKREGFTFEPEFQKGLASILGLVTPAFKPDPGNTSRLTVPSASLFFNGDGSLGTSSIRYNPMNPAWVGYLRLSTDQGIDYIIDGPTGLIESVIDNNGNTLLFSDDGIINAPTGKSIDFERDGQGRIAAVIDPLGNRVEYTYDLAGDLVSVTDREQNTTRFVYDQPQRDHFLTEVIDPLGRTGIRTEYDDQGRLLQMFDAAGESVDFAYDPDNYVLTVTDQLGNPTTYEYDLLGNVLTERDAEGGITRRTYDDPNNATLETSITDPEGNTTRYEYDQRGNVTAETDANGNISRTTYRSFNTSSFEIAERNLGALVAASVTGAFSATLNALKNQPPPRPFSVATTVTDPLGAITTTSYDSGGNPLSIVDPDGLSTRISYIASGIVGVSSGLPRELTIGSNKTTLEYDSAGNVTREVDAVGTSRTFTYDVAGNQLTESVVFTTSNGPSTVVTENEYDREGRVTKSFVKQDGVLLSQNETKYDAVGNRIEAIDGLGRSTKFVYDERGQLSETIFPDDTPLLDDDNPRTTTQYDAAGNVTARLMNSEA